MKRTFILVTLAGLGCLTGACGTHEDVSLDGLKLPIAQTRSATPPPATPTPAASKGGTGGGAPARVTKPVVAKTQKWVKIFSGPSDKDVKPNADKRQGSKTVELNAVENDRIGTFVTDGAGRTLYRFDNDQAKPPKATCNGDCATAWPPLLIKSPGKIFPTGIDPKTIGYVERADGHCQVTINGWPVYYFIADNKPGDINGQGLNGTWFAITPDGGRTKQIPGFPLNSAGS
jgi:predicted lipoprotein with Yx(FWY)xxD motif